MYRTVITFKDDVPGDVLASLKESCVKAFDNRAGKAAARNEAPRRMVFEGDEDLWGCLHLGIITLYKETFEFKEKVASWEWIDEDPDECCNVLKSMAIPIY